MSSFVKSCLLVSSILLASSIALAEEQMDTTVTPASQEVAASAEAPKEEPTMMQKVESKIDTEEKKVEQKHKKAKKSKKTKKHKHKHKKHVEHHDDHAVAPAEAAPLEAAPVEQAPTIAPAEEQTN